MRVLHLSTTDIRGGASRGSYWLHQALVGMGVDSRMLVGRKYSEDGRVTQLRGNMAPLEEWARCRLDELPLRFYDKTNDSFWTTAWFPRRLQRAVEAFKPDLVHLHWTGAGFLSVESLAGISAPLVWTLRDMWAFTGGCHYTAGCERFTQGCGQCPQLRSHREDDLSRSVWQRKLKAYTDNQRLNLVPISTWLADCCERSPLFNNVPITVIPNGLDSQCFRPIPRERACEAWGLDPAKRYVIYGAIDALSDKRKGFAELAEATRRLAGACWTTRGVELVVFGDLASDTTPPLGLKTHFVGRVNDDDRLAHLYAAGDVMVVPSLQEAFGKTVIEAMACGTPVVAFDHGGPADIINHRVTGYLAEPFDPVDLAHGIAWCLEKQGRAEMMGKKARARVDERYNLDVIAINYLDLYRSILGRTQ
jgi:glycosyltransferase involved in cell wall biosynthesis